MIKVNESGKYRILIRQQVMDLDPFKEKLRSIEDGRVSTIGKKLGVGSGTISQILKYNKRPTENMIGKIAAELGISGEDLLEGCGSHEEVKWITMWIFVDEQRKHDFELLKIGEKLESFKPITAAELNNDGVVDLMVAITEKAFSDKKSWERLKDVAGDDYKMHEEWFTADWWLKPFGEKCIKRQTKKN